MSSLHSRDRGHELLRRCGDLAHVAVGATGLGDGTAHSDRRDACGEPVADVGGGDATRRKDRDVRQRRQDRLGVRDAAGFGGEELDDAGAGLGRIEDLGRRVGTTDSGDLVAVGDADHLGVEVRADEELRAGLNARPSGVPVEDGARTEDHIFTGEALGQALDHAEGAGDRQGDLEGADAAGDGCRGDLERLLGAVEADDEDVAGIADRLYDVEFLEHGPDGYTNFTRFASRVQDALTDRGEVLHSVLQSISAIVLILEATDAPGSSSVQRSRRRWTTSLRPLGPRPWCWVRPTGTRRCTERGSLDSSA